MALDLEGNTAPLNLSPKFFSLLFFMVNDYFVIAKDEHSL